MSLKYSSYNPEELREFKEFVSLDRFNTYLKESSDNTELALYLYALNTTLSSAFYGCLQVVEITLRNSIHQQLSKEYGEEWYGNQKLQLNRAEIDAINHNKNFLLNNNKSSLPDNPTDEDVRELEEILYTPPNIIANFNFSFWVALLGTGSKKKNQKKKIRYVDTLWIPTLHKAFPHGRSIKRK